MVVRLKAQIRLTIAQKERRRALVVPREHGAWGMLLVPLVTGAAVGVLAGGRIAPVLLLTTAVLSLFWLRTPVESWLGTSAVRAQTPEERNLVRYFILPVGAVAAVSLSALFWQGKNRELLWLGMIASARLCSADLLEENGTSDEDGSGSGGRGGAHLDRACRILCGHRAARCESMGAVAG